LASYGEKLIVKSLAYVLADVFTDRRFGGNQLAVFPQAGDLPTELMQTIARELNLSETVFVFPPESADLSFSIRIFTPGAELPFAGHPTIGTAIVLDAVGALKNARNVGLVDEHTSDIVLGEGVGPVPVRLSRSGGVLRAVLTSPRFPARVGKGPGVSIEAELLGLDETDIAAETETSSYSAGVPFTIISLQSRDTLARIQFNNATWGMHFKGAPAPHILAVFFDRANVGELHVRMFAPAMGIPEDPATGAAAVALAGFLTDHHKRSDAAQRWVIHQGVDMGRPSLIELEIDLATESSPSVRVGGSAVIIGKGVLELEG
jgi:trans-2,3-dihydro-3-hydroxyanthranilate isomerase